jgi:hypothetical protein
VILPPLLANENNLLTLFMVCMSRLIRMYKAEEFFMRLMSVSGDDEVRRGLTALAIWFLLQAYICSGLFMVIENFSLENLK